ncbi:MAG TPA: hypothetical protein VFH91_02270 [Pyrinomonadaceae bacterium]|nr:hypothetical protein [Pyrinomonadaceae bacterium]
MPSSLGYLTVAIVLALGLFFGLWWMLVSGGDEAPWLPAGLAASVVLLVALSAREVVMRRAWTRYLLENGIQQRSKRHSASSGRSQKKGFSASYHSAALRAIQKQSEAADTSGRPELHFDAAQLCHDYLLNTEEGLRNGSYGTEKVIAVRAGQERVRNLRRHHLLVWARNQSQALTREAQTRVRTSDKIETANKALDCIDQALTAYPTETELKESRIAIEEFIVSVKVAHWVELAERSAFKGHYRRAIDRYRDALYYLNHEAVKPEVRAAGAAKIEREIDSLTAKLRARQREHEMIKENPEPEGDYPA